LPAVNYSLVTAFYFKRIEFVSLLGGHMFEVYLNDRRDLLVIKKGTPAPLIAASGKWRKRKEKVVRVSDEISFAVQRQGYYLRKLSDKNHR
jgi:hypothetical protein